MDRTSKIWMDLNDLTTDAQVINYWENRHSRILETLTTADSNFEIATKILHRLTKSFNDRERYSSVYYLFKTGFVPIAHKLNFTKYLSELKFELGRGLHHNRKYEHSKRLFNELASEGFDTSRIDGWWNQTVIASTRDKNWFNTDFLPTLGRLAIMVAYIAIVINTKEFLISTTAFILIFELYEFWWYQFKVLSYLKEFQGSPELTKIKKKIKKQILIELGFSLLFYPIYYLNQEWLFPLVFIIVLYFLTFHIVLNYYYLPKLITDLNRKKNTTLQNSLR